MTYSFLSPTPHFTLDSLVTSAQWSAARAGKRKAPPKNQIMRQLHPAPKSTKLDKSAS